MAQVAALVNSSRTRGPLQENEPVVFLDRKDREYLFRLDRRRPVAIRGGKISVDAIIGCDEGSVVRSSVNEPFLVFRPSMPQLVPNLPRNAQVTGDIDIHELGVETSGRVIFINTLYSCLAAFSRTDSFTPLWKPKARSAPVRAASSSPTSRSCASPRRGRRRSWRKHATASRVMPPKACSKSSAAVNGQPI